MEQRKEERIGKCKEERISKCNVNRIYEAQILCTYLFKIDIPGRDYLACVVRNSHVCCPNQQAYLPLHYKCLSETYSVFSQREML